MTWQGRVCSCSEICGINMTRVKNAEVKKFRPVEYYQKDIMLVLM